MSELEVHPLAALFPLMEPAGVADLAASIAARGLDEPIVLYEGKILDGRSRYRACRDLGIEPLFAEPYIGDDPVGFVIGRNLPHHKLSESQRALIGAQFATIKAGQNQHILRTIPPTQITLRRAGELLHVSGGLVSLARTILAKGSSDQIAAIRRGEASVYATGLSVRADGNPKPHRPRKPRNTDAQAQRTQTLRIQGQMWGHLRDAINHLAALPLPSEVVGVARRSSSGDLIERRLDKSIQWLEDFRHAWSNRDQTPT